MRKPPAFAAAAALLAACAPAFAGPVVSKGTFVDAAGGRHEWTVNGAHTLIWDGKPFVPVGGLFQVQSWGPGAGEADFAADVKALAALKASGIRDVYLQAPKGGITRVPPAALQRVIDVLEKEGITYGLSLNDGPTEVLAGYDVRPGKYRNVAPENGGLVRFPIDRAASALYFLVAETGGDVIASGEAAVVAEGARVDVPPIPGKNVVFVLPQVAHFSAATIGFPNVWEGFDAYRDQLILLFRQVKLGKGFRFFLDPLPSGLGYPEEAESFVPVGTAFQSEWGEWLARRYKNVDNLQRAWSVSDNSIRQFSDAASALPLWGGGKGVEFLYDPATNRSHRVVASSSTYWKDLNAFKLASLRDYMNDLAEVLKQTAGDAPVVYRSRGYSPLFAGLPATRGFDGIGIDAYGRGTDLVTRHAGYVYAQAAEAPKTLWTPVTATADALPAEKSARGYANRTALHGDLDWLREIGARGFFVDGVRVVDPARRANYDLSETPEQLRWLSDYGDVLTATGVSTAAAPPPNLVFFPRGLGSASVRPLKGGSWWLPTDRTGAVYDFGASGRVYGLSEPDGSIVYYLWNPSGTRQIQLRIPKSAKAPGAAPIRWSATANGVSKKDTLTLTIGPDPVRLFNFPTIPIPVDAFDATQAEAKKLLSVLRKQGSLDAGRYENALAAVRARAGASENPILSLAEAQQLLAEVRDLVRTYCWVDAERTKNHSFDTVSDRVGASAGQLLRVGKRQPGMPDAVARYTIAVRAPGPYDLWVAASPDSSLTFRMDGKPLLDEAVVARPVGQPYADGALVWMRLGVTNLPAGVHVLEMRAAGAATVDAFLLTRDPFTPNGPTPPPILPEEGDDKEK